ncbi:MAG: hypothetical protein J6V58_03205 [Clostridia bacterium]|nr:hypothetical protein [Clostridia bacterium]
MDNLGTDNLGDEAVFVTKTAPSLNCENITEQEREIVESLIEDLKRALGGE